MKRRETLKTLLVGTVAGGALAGGVAACKTEPEKLEEANVETDVVEGLYGRTPEEIARDKALTSKTFFTEHELATVAILCDIILPKDELSGSATEAEVPKFIEFIAKDMPNHQLPLRGGIMWLDHETNRRFNKSFKNCNEAEQLMVVDEIAWRDRAEELPHMTQGIKFFDLMRNLTLTGFYTSKMGVKTLGYQGNMPNLWDGVPEEVMAEHDVALDEEWLSKCINHDTRETVAEWDDEGNLIA